MKFAELQDLMLYIYMQLIDAIKRGEATTSVTLPTFLTLVEKLQNKEAFVVETEKE